MSEHKTIGRKKHRDDGRKASAPLYVMLTPEQKERYERAATEARMTMREYVVNALEAQVAEQTANDIAVGERLMGSIPEPSSGDTANDQLATIRSYVSSHGLRLNRIEKVIETFYRQLEQLDRNRGTR